MKKIITKNKTVSKKKRTSAKQNKVLILKTVNSKMKAHGGFTWPSKGHVEAPDWDPKPECGKGLHGALWGEGVGDLFSWATDAHWIVFEALASEVVDLEGKVKVPRGEVVHVGDQRSATEYLQNHGCKDKVIIGATKVVGHNQVAVVGYDGTATAGEDGTATAGNYGTATVGNYGTAMSGHRGTATAGNYGKATAGECGTATAGEGGILQIKWYDGKRSRISTGYIGENGLKPNTPYRLNDKGEFVKVEVK